MTAQIGRFSRIASVRGLPDRRSWALCVGPFSVIHPRNPGFGPLTPQSTTVVAHHERESWMARRKLTVDRHEEIKRRLADGRRLREIATALGCSRRLVRQIRDGDRLTHETAASPDPLWMSQLEWPVIIHELGLGHPMKFIWEERAKALITVQKFLKTYQARAGEAGVDLLGHYMGPLAYAQMQVVAQAVEATGSLDDARLSKYARDSPFDTVMGTVKFGAHGEWAEPRVLQVQFQGISGAEVGQFQNGSRQIVVSPPQFTSGELRFPYADVLCFHTSAFAGSDVAPDLGTPSGVRES
jgi:hypothetical protein